MILDGLLSHFQDTLSFEYVLLYKKLIINLKAGLFFNNRNIKYCISFDNVEVNVVIGGVVLTI